MPWVARWPKGLVGRVGSGRENGRAGEMTTAATADPHVMRLPRIQRMLRVSAWIGGSSLPNTPMDAAKG